MGLFNRLFGKKEELIYEGENLYQKIKADSVSDPVEMYEPLDKEIIEQGISEDRIVQSMDEKKTNVEHICEQMVICAGRIESAKREYDAVNSYINDISTIENLEEPYKGNVEYYARRLITLRDDKNSMKAHATRIPESKFIYMQRHEDEIKDILKDMYDDEQDCQRLKTDMHHIEGEKVALKYEKRDAIQKLGIIRTFAKMGIISIVLIILILVIAQAVTGTDFTLGIYIVVIGALVLGAGLIVGNQKFTYELKMAEKKLNKAVGLMNKYKLLYVNVKSRLDYQYETHGVKSSYELNDLWRLYLTAKKEHEAFHLNADNTFKAVEGLIAELDKVKLYDSSVWPSQVDAIIDPREMTEIRHTLNVRRQKLRESITFNTNTIENSKARIQAIIDKNPVMAKEILAMLDKYENILGM
ncbi:MAG: hypothetical protein IJP13_04155 [Lachnospiraceae bacterium]|nr:hypothetical protein [Lachnospiraceae bacterium]